MYYYSLSFFSSFVSFLSSFFVLDNLSFISVVFLHIVNSNNENSNPILASKLPRVNCNMNAMKLIDIKENDDNVIYIATIMYNIFSNYS